MVSALVLGSGSQSSSPRRNHRVVFLRHLSLTVSFNPGSVKFRFAHQAEILLRLYGQFHPGRKTQISMGKFTEMRKHDRCACSRSFFSPG